MSSSAARRDIQYRCYAVANESLGVDVFANRTFQRLGATLKVLHFVRRHVRPQHLGDTGASDNTRQGQRNTVTRIVRTDRKYSALIAQYHLCYAARNHADSVLARADPFDDRNVGVTHVMLDSSAELIERNAALAQHIVHAHPADTR